MYISFLTFPISTNPIKDVPGPGLIDVLSGRKTMVLQALEELIETGNRYDVDMLVCQSVADRIKSLELGLAAGDFFLIFKTLDVSR